MIPLDQIRARLRTNPPRVPPVGIPLRTDRPTPNPTKLARVVDRAASLCPVPGPLCAWAVRRERQYFDGPGQTWGHALIAYAVARDILVSLTPAREPDL
jgi:hypothetical protein